MVQESDTSARKIPIKWWGQDENDGGEKEVKKYFRLFGVKSEKFLSLGEKKFDKTSPYVRMKCPEWRLGVFKVLKIKTICLYCNRWRLI